jgi:hypothetical protein
MSSCAFVFPDVPERQRLAAKSAYRDPKPKVQAKKVLLSKWKPRNQVHIINSPDVSCDRFHKTFVELPSASKEAAMRELFLMKSARRGKATRCLLNVASLLSARGQRRARC